MTHEHIDKAALAQLNHYLERAGYIVGVRSPFEAHEEVGEALPGEDWAKSSMEIQTAKRHAKEILSDYPPEVRGILNDFVRKIESAAQSENVPALLSTWQDIVDEVATRRAINSEALSGKNKRKNKVNNPAEIENFFEQAVASIFNEEMEIVNKKRTLTTLKTFWILPWPVKQRLHTLVNRPKDKQGKLDYSLEDDYLHLNRDGMVFYSPDLGVDKKEYAWSQIESLVFETNAAAVLDWINRVRRWIPRLAQTSWQLFGVLKVTDRHDGQELVKIMMKYPEQYADKIKELGALMNKKLESPTPLNPVAEIEMEELLEILPPTLLRNISNLLAQVRNPI